MDPLRSTTIYSNNFYSRQFLDLIQGHLNLNGILLFWMDEFTVIRRQSQVYLTM